MTNDHEPFPLELFAPGTTLEGDELVLGGCRASAIARAVGTPALVMDEAALRARARRYREGLAARWADSRVVWASKSLPVTAIYRTLAEEGLGVDVAGGGELVMALRAGVDPATTSSSPSLRTLLEKSSITSVPAVSLTCHLRARR